MKTAIFILTLLGVFYLSSCSSSGDLEQQYFEKGVYDFTLFDRGGDSLAVGSFDIETINGKDISGSYIFDKVFQSNQLLTPNVKKEMKGSLSDDRKQVFINANPRLADANVFLRITAGLLTYSGKWEYSTFVGIVDNGTIKAEKRE